MNTADQRFQTFRVLVPRAHGAYLLIASVLGVRMDLLGIFYGAGPETSIVSAAPHSGVGFLEAHGLAFLISLWLLRATPSRALHLTGAAAGALLGACNLAFWEIFLAADILWAGYLTTSLHWLFAVTGLMAAFLAVRESGSEGDYRAAAAESMGD